MNTATTTSRVVVYQRCPICGRARLGYNARGWPAGAVVCPNCATTTRVALAYGVDRLSPEVEADSP